MNFGNIIEAEGLGAVEREQLRTLMDIYRSHLAKNALKRRYYEGHIPLSEVNLGIALPEGLRGLEIGCAWGEKAVDVLAARSMFDGFVAMNGERAETMTQLANANRLTAEYAKACRDELKYGCTFATLSADRAIGCRIRFHSPETAAASWSGEKGRIASGFAVIDMTFSADTQERVPSLVNLYTDEAIWVLRRTKNNWTAERHAHRMGHPLMEPLTWNATSKKPFGRSRLKEPVRRLIQSYVRTVANATIGLEFSTSPQKYLLGVTDDQYDAVISERFRTYVGSMFTSTDNPETGKAPTFGQLPQGTIEPHVQMLRILATQFSAATGLTVTDVGVVNDANPTSSDAILAQSQTLVLMAEQLNASNGDALYNIAQMAQAIAAGTTVEALSDEARGVIAHFKNPAMPSVSVTADAAVKIAGVRPEFAATDVFAEMLGFSQADIRRIRAQEARARGLAVLSEEFTAEEGEDNDALTV